MLRYLQLQMIRVIKVDKTNSEKIFDRIQHDILRPTNLCANMSAMLSFLQNTVFRASLKGMVNAIQFTKFNTRT